MSERYQERPYKKSEVQMAYDDAKEKIETIIRESNLSDTPYDYIESDLYAMLFVVADFTAHNFNNRENISVELLPYLSFGGFNSLFKPSERTEFYGKIIRRTIKLRGECLPIDAPPSITNAPWSRCAIAFCDILINFSLIFNYENTPVVLRGFDKSLDFASEVVVPIINIVSDFVSKIMELCGVNIEDENPPMHNKNQQNNEFTNNSSETSTAKILIVTLLIFLGIAAYIIFILSK